jgi:DNA-binding MarR family transcriptional regulator
VTGSTFDHRALDPVIHSRIRLSVMAVLASVDDAEFTFLRDRVNATDGNLSTHLGRLADAGYVESERALQDGRAVTRYHLTADGQRAFAEYLRHMEALLKGLDR